VIVLVHIYERHTLLFEGLLISKFVMLTVWEEEPRLDGGSYDAKRTATTAAGRFNSCLCFVGDN